MGFKPSKIKKASSPPFYVICEPWNIRYINLLIFIVNINWATEKIHNFSVLNPITLVVVVGTGWQSDSFFVCRHEIVVPFLTCQFILKLVRSSVFFCRLTRKFSQNTYSKNISFEVQNVSLSLVFTSMKLTLLSSFLRLRVASGK